MAYASDDDGSGLPPVNTRRWTPLRKAQVVNAVRDGVLSFAQACERYRLSDEELTAWQSAVAVYGTPGLRVTRLRQYRDGPPARPGRGTPSVVPLRLSTSHNIRDPSTGSLQLQRRGRRYRGRIRSA